MELDRVVTGVGVLVILKAGAGENLIAASCAEVRTTSVKDAPDMSRRAYPHSNLFALGVLENISDKIARKR